MDGTVGFSETYSLLVCSDTQVCTWSSHEHIYRFHFPYLLSQTRLLISKIVFLSFPLLGFSTSSTSLPYPQVLVCLEFHIPLRRRNATTSKRCEGSQDNLIWQVAKYVGIHATPREGRIALADS